MRCKELRINWLSYRKPFVNSKESLSSGERVELPLGHKETGRVPIAMICSGINSPVYVALEIYLPRTPGISVKTYLEPLIDIKAVEANYVLFQTLSELSENFFVTILD